MGVNYQVRLFNEAEDIEQTVEVQEDRYILETVEEAGMELPYSCRQGVCLRRTKKRKLFRFGTLRRATRYWARDKNFQNLDASQTTSSEIIATYLLEREL